jgi:hypothetical protein
VSCFNIRAEYLRISLGHTFHPIELIRGVLPILVIQNQTKIQKNRIKKSKKWISISAALSSSFFPLASSFCIIILNLEHLFTLK